MLWALKFQLDKLRRAKFPNVPLRAKHHFLQHYFNWIRNFGSLRYSWTLGFENKHRYFKNVVRHILNFKNALKSLVELSQLSSAVSENYTGQKIDSVIPKHSEIIKEIEHASELLVMKNSNVNVKIFEFIAKEFSFRGIQYKSGMSVCFSIDEYGFYNLCIIENIIFISNCDDLLFIGYSCKIYYDYTVMDQPV